MFLIRWKDRMFQLELLICLNLLDFECSEASSPFPKIFLDKIFLELLSELTQLTKILAKFHSLVL